MQSKANQDGIQLMTLHAGKGLEFPVVFLTGLEEGLFPIKCPYRKMIASKKKGVYVMWALRAPNKNYLFHAQSRRLHGKSIQRPSRFIAELPAESIQEVIGNDLQQKSNAQPGCAKNIKKL